MMPELLAFWEQVLTLVFTRNVCQYDYKNYPIRFIGSVAYSYSEILREVARDFGVELDIIEETPMDGLIEFHSMNIEEP